MLRSGWRHARIDAASWIVPQCTGRRASSSSALTRQHDALNILFCGADEFSICSLRALRELQSRRPGSIGNIDVVCRPDKLGGRGMKQVRQVPIKPIASELGLTLHQLDTFKGWSPPASVNLVVAVSFGLLVPARILTGAKYGGLNVHPSLLPDFRGPAPIVHTLLKRRSHTGVTVQTMHPTTFDHGAILAQTLLPGIEVPPDGIPDDLLRVLGPLGAEMLCQTIEEGLFVPPAQSLERANAPEQLDHAPKITSEDRHIDWSTWTADELILRDGVLGRLWDMHTYGRCAATTPGIVTKRVTFSGPWRQCNLNEMDLPMHSNIRAGDAIHLHDFGSTRDTFLGLVTSDHKVVCPASATIDGEKRGTGLMALTRRMGISTLAPYMG